MDAANFSARSCVFSLLLAAAGTALGQAPKIAPASAAMPHFKRAQNPEPARLAETCHGCDGCHDCFNFPGPKNYSAHYPKHAKKYPPHTCWMVRYTYHYGVHYDRPYDYRTLSDFPWHSRKGFGPDAPAFDEAFEEEWLPEGATPLARGIARAAKAPAENTARQPAFVRPPATVRFVDSAGR